MEKIIIPFENHSYFYNLEKEKVAFITMDVDWASDEVLKWTFDWFIENEISITAFATHNSIELKKHENNPFIEIAIHPNFSKTLDPQKKVEELLTFYPNSVGSRSHRNIVGRDYLDILYDNGLNYDSSKLLWRAPNLQIYPLYNGMLDIPYNWEDGVHLELNESNEINALEFDFQGLRIFNIHPVLFFLDYQNFDQLKGFTSKYSDLAKVPFCDFLNAKSNIKGIGSYSKELFLALKSLGYKFHLYNEIVKPASIKMQEIRLNNNYWY